MKLAGHMVRMKDERLSKRSETKKQDGCRKRGKPKLRREDCLKRDLRTAEEEGKVKRNEGQQQEAMEKITKVAVQRSVN